MVLNKLSSNGIRWLLASLTSVLMLFVWLNFVYLWTSPNDENWFTTNFFSLSITQGFPAKPLFKPTEYGSTGIEQGDLIVSINHFEVRTADELARQLKAIEEFNVFDVTVMRPTTGEMLPFKVAKHMLPKNLVREIPPSVYVLEVVPGGASDRAGMLKGDLIIRIEGKGFATAKDADQIMRTTRAGQNVRYDVLRQNRLMTLNVTMAKFGIPLHLMVIRLSGLLFVLFGVFLWATRPMIKAARIHGIAFSLIGAGMALVLPSRFSAYVPMAQLLTWVRWFSITLGTAALIHGRYYFPREIPEFMERPWTRYLPYGMAIILAIWGVVLGEALLFPAVAILVGYHWIIANVYRGPLERARAFETRLINWATGLSLISLAVMALVPDFRRNFMGLVGIPLLLLPCSYFYTMARFGLLDLKFRIRRTVQYSTLSIGWACLLILLFVFSLRELAQLEIDIPNIHFSMRSIEVLESPVPAIHQQNTVKKLLMIIAVVGAWLLLKIGRWGQKLIDRRFHRSGYDYRRATSELAENLSRKLSIKDLADTIVDKICDFMYLRQAALVVMKSNEWLTSAKTRGIDAQQFDDFLHQHANQLAHSLTPFFGEVSVDYLDGPIRSSLRKFSFSYAVPVRSKGSLLAILLVGEKLSESSIEQEDLRFLNSTTKQIAVSLENTLLYEQLADQERWRHELEIARQIQLSSLPQGTPNVSGLSISAVSEPAMEVGGDYFDYLLDGQKLMVIVGDVSGKGTSAALHMSKLQGVLRSLHRLDEGPVDLLCRANPILCHNVDAKSFVTALAVQFDPLNRRCRIARAGHLPLFHYRCLHDDVIQHAPPGISLALDQTSLFDKVIEEIEVAYDDGDVFLLASDGITEAFNADGRAYGESRLSATLRSYAELSATEIQARIMAEVTDFADQNSAQDDDMTAVIVKAIPVDIHVIKTNSTSSVA